jgi:hypothetical protein
MKEDRIKPVPWMVEEAIEFLGNMENDILAKANGGIKWQ